MVLDYAIFILRKHREKLTSTGENKGKCREFYLYQNVASLLWGPPPDGHHPLSVILH